jgi:hypothetical protein
MSRTTAFSIIIGFVLLFGGGVAYWYYSLSGKTLTPEQNNSSNTTGSNPFPFGQTGQPNTKPNQTGVGTSTTGSGETPAPVVREISSTPTGSFSPFVDKTNGTSVRYIEQETGNVYDAPLDITLTKRVSNTTIPKVHQAIWLPQARSFIAQYLGGNTETIQSFYGEVNPQQTEGAEGNVTGKFLEDGITSLISISSFSASTTSKNPGKIFYTKNTNAGTDGFIAEGNGTAITKVFSSPLSEWLLLGGGGSTVYLQTKSSGLASSYLFSLNTSSGSLSKVLGNIVGLSSLPNAKGDMILYSETVNKAPLLHIYNVSKNTYGTITLSTLADKCVWAEGKGVVNAKIYCAVPQTIPVGITLPDSWYQGKTTFTDNIWEINPTSLEAKKVASLTENSFYVDIYNPALSSNGSYLLFINKRDLTLWSVRLSN